MILDIFRPQTDKFVGHNQIILFDFRHFPTTINHNQPQSDKFIGHNQIILVDFRHFSTTINHNQIILVNFRHFPTTINHNRPQSTYQKSTTINQNCGWKMSKIVQNYEIVVDCGWLWSSVVDCGWLWSIVVDCGRLWLIVQTTIVVEKCLEIV